MVCHRLESNLFGSLTKFSQTWLNVFMGCSVFCLSWPLHTVKKTAERIPFASRAIARQVMDIETIAECFIEKLRA